MRPSIRLLVLALSMLTLSAVAGDAADPGPRPGKYRIMTYGATSKPPLFIGYFVLGAGTYRAFLPGDKPSGEGRFTFDAATQQVVWKSGPYVGMWGGEFTIDRDGKTHKIRLKKTTIATNSVDGGP